MPKNQIEVKFTKDFASKKAGDIGCYSSELASQLIRVDKVAVKNETTKKKSKK